MAQQTIGVGTAANDGTGDKIRDAFVKINANETELYTSVASNTTALAAKAALASPTFTGTPAAPTAAAATNTTQIATTAMVQAAIAAYIAAQDVLVFKGAKDCSTNPNYPAADAGHVYRVSVAGKIGGSSGTKVEAGDVLTCITDSSASGTQASVGANWIITQANLDGAVIGPASATDARIAVFDGTTGKLLKDGGSTIADIVSGASDVAATIHAATEKTTPADNDELGLVDSADSNSLKKLLWSTLKSAFGYSANVRLHKNGTDQSLTSDNTFYKVTWSTAAEDNQSIFDNTNDRVTVARAGVYNVKAQIVFTTGLAAGELPFIRLYINGSADQRNSVASPGTSDVAVSLNTTRRLAANDYVEIYAKKNTGSNTKLYGVSVDTVFEVTYLSP